MNKIVDLEHLIGAGYPDLVSTVDVALIRSTLPVAAPVERVHAHIVIIPAAGSGTHLVDFETVPVQVGTAVHVQPGQVMRFDRDGTYDATVVILRPSVCSPDLFLPGEHAPVVSLDDAQTIVRSLADDLVREAATPFPDSSIMVASGNLLLHHLARAGTVAPESSAVSASAALVREFRTSLESHYRSSRSVTEHARRIGTTTRTLSRATAERVGQTPKEMIDARVALEAKRQLVHTTDQIATVGSRLGFTEATNFTKFFIRVTGQSPQQFRER